MGYEKPFMDVIQIETEDIVCTSGLTGEGKGDNNDGWTE